MLRATSTSQTPATTGCSTIPRAVRQPPVFTANTCATSPAVSAGGLNIPTDATLDSGGNLYVTDFSNTRLVYYAAGSTTATRVYGQLVSGSQSFTCNTANQVAANTCGTSAS